MHVGPGGHPVQPPHFTDEEAISQRGQGAHPRSDGGPGDKVTAGTKSLSNTGNPIRHAPSFDAFLGSNETQGPSEHQLLNTWPANTREVIAVQRWGLMQEKGIHPVTLHHP